MFFKKQYKIIRWSNLTNVVRYIEFYLTDALDNDGGQLFFHYKS